MIYDTCTNFSIMDSGTFLLITGLFSISVISRIHCSYFSKGRHNRSFLVFVIHPSTIIISLDVPSANNFGIERFYFLGTGLSAASGRIDTCKASGADAAFFL